MAKTVKRPSDAVLNQQRLIMEIYSAPPNFVPRTRSPTVPARKAQQFQQLDSNPKRLSQKPVRTFSSVEVPYS